MATNVNVNLTGFQTTGSNVNVAQYEIQVDITWINNAGQSQSHSELVRFPNILNHANISNAWRKEKLTQLLLEALREIQGVDA